MKNFFSVPVFEKIVSPDVSTNTRDAINPVIDTLQYTEEISKTGTMLTSDEGVKPTNNFISRYNLTDLENEVVKSANEYLRSLNIIPYTTISIFMSWLTKINPGNKSSKHIHDPTTLVGVYYCDSLPDQGNLKLYNPLPKQFQTVSEVEIIPEPGKLIFFPGWLEHEVQENKSSLPRHSIAINIQVYEYGK